MLEAVAFGSVFLPSSLVWLNMPQFITQHNSQFASDINHSSVFLSDQLDLPPDADLIANLGRVNILAPQVFCY